MTELKGDRAPDAAEPASAVDPRLYAPPASLAGYVGQMRRRIRSGDLGALPVVVGLIIIAIVFQSANSRFLSSQNLSNLSLQMVSTGVIAVGVVLVLLLGEIDLSIGSVSGVCASVMTVLNIQHGWAPVPAVVAGVVIGAGIGLLQGLVFAKIGVPSFIVTLAGLIGWQGLQLWVLQPQGTINLPYGGGVAKLANTFFAGAVGYVIVIAITAIYFAASLVRMRRSSNAGLPTRPFVELVVKAALLGVVLILIVVLLDGYRGVPLALLIFVGLIVFFDLVLRRTRYGRKIFAVGGNTEAARRAGINVTRVRVTVFMLGSALAAFGGILAASRLFAVNQGSGGGDVLLNAIAAAVIGGTSLFGGRGSTYSALLGILVIQSIANGMDLLGLSQYAKFMITGLVLLAAVVIDSLSRRGRKASGSA